MNANARIALSLLLMRLSVALVLLMWILDKFVRPDHAVAIFAAFYSIQGVGTAVVYVLAMLQLLVVIAFVIGFRKGITYLIVLFMHALSTVIALPKYFAPFTDPNLLFFAAWPMLAACFALYMLRDMDTLWTVESQSNRSLTQQPNRAE
ncbi:hypothetical protein IQ241_05725 [Romeria aff. gracilis LEGE 07310]|uniref:DoxX protein n=1 Tax=Vasconcelosia minhoensis LEGE 07310 TaxID=915328 RepID=A0A8J7AFZ4_9CYAN|nr:hypothetical protein [Romeria gracilis]MBE9076798.1 hypothetical protein [Romeria aff. gracilis LEGE 07310]